MEKLKIQLPPDVSVVLGKVDQMTGWRNGCEVSDGLFRLGFKYDHMLDLKGETQEVIDSMISRLRSVGGKRVENHDINQTS